MNSSDNGQINTQLVQPTHEVETNHDNVLTVCSQANADSFVLLSTALVYDADNQPIICRALLDSASSLVM